MDRSLTATRNRSALRPRASASNRPLGLRDHAHRTNGRGDTEFGGGDYPPPPQVTLSRQHAALANMVRAVEPDFANEMAERLLAKYGSLTAVLSEPAEELRLSTGNPALATILSTAKHVVVESLLDDLPKTPFSPSNQDVLRYITAIMSGLTHEEAHVFFLDGRLRFLRHEVFCYGTEKDAQFPMHIVFRRALQIGASQLVLIHNHPSGSPEPSDEDKQVTQRIAAAGHAIGLAIRDHLIVAGSNVFSFRAAGLL
jgi:DNA repair protein RadC